MPIAINKTIYNTVKAYSFENFDEDSKVFFMALIETVVDKKHDLTVHRVIGEVDGEEIIEKIQEGLKQQFTCNVIWDFSDAYNPKLSMDKMRQILMMGKMLASARGHGKTAIVVPQDLGFGLGRMFEAHSEIESFPIVIRAFRTLDQAHEWLGISTT